MALGPGVAVGVTVGVGVIVGVGDGVGDGVTFLGIQQIDPFVHDAFVPSLEILPSSQNCDRSGLDAGSILRHVLGASHMTVVFGVQHTPVSKTVLAGPDN